MKVSLRFHNDTYAPGIATYGIDGKTGEQGKSGVSMFFTDYSFPREFVNFGLKITSRMLPLKTEETVLDRKFINGDTFVCKDGKIYLLIDIDTLTIDSRNGTSPDNIETVIKLIGQFDLGLVPFTTYRDNTVREKKITIRESGTETSGDGLLSLIKNNSNGTGELNFINMQALFGSNPDINLDIKYNNSVKAFVLESKYPIVINAPLYVNYTGTSILTSNYSPVLCNNNGITEFIGTCKEIKYDIDASIYLYTKSDSSTIYYGSLYSITLSDAADDLDESNNLERYYTNASIIVHYLNKDLQDFQMYRTGEKTYHFKLDYDYVKLNDIINKVAYLELNDILISLVNNFEVYLVKNNKSVSGFNGNITKKLIVN